MNPLVSVVIPCYNQAEYLPETLDSLLTQTYQNWEAIIVNDGSLDNTEQVANAYVNKDSRIKYIRQQNGGLSSARNCGIKIAQGEFILPLDSDDKIAPEYISEAMSAFKNNPALTLVYCKGEFFGTKKGVWEGLYYQGYRKQLLNNSIFCSAFFRKSDWERVGGYDESMRKGYEDWEFFIRLLNGEKEVYQIPILLFYYRIKDVSMVTESKKEETSIEIEAYIYSKHKDIYYEYFKASALRAYRDFERHKLKREKRRKKWYKKLFHKYIKK